MPQDPNGPTEWQDTPELAARRAEAKREMLAGALAAGKTQLRIDTRRPGVRVPDRYLGEPALALNLSWRFAHTEMVLNDHGVAATLRFDRVPFRCLLPWSSIWGLLSPGSDAVHVWPPDLPEVLGGPPRPDEEPAPPPVEPTRPQLSVLRGVGDRPASELPPAPVKEVAPRRELEPRAAEVTGEEASPPARAPWLRLVR